MNDPIVLIRGLFRSQFHWGGFPDILQKRYPDRKIICLDIPGAGERHTELSPTSILGMVDSIRQRFEYKGKVDIIAISMGGMIGLKWAQLYPDEVSSVVCINTSVKNMSPFYQRLKPKNYLKLLIALCSNSNKRETVIYQLVSNKPVDLTTITRWVEIEAQYPTRKVNFFRQLYAASRFNVSCPVCPLLFISSAQDKLVNAKATRAIALKWEKSLILNNEDGHDIPLDNPTWLCLQLGDWLK